jgi:hypothetical protein
VEILADERTENGIEVFYQFIPGKKPVPEYLFSIPACAASICAGW